MRTNSCLGALICAGVIPAFFAGKALAQDALESGHTELTRKPMVGDKAKDPRFLVLARDDDGHGFLYRLDADGAGKKLTCEALEGAWGLWVEDVDRDGRLEAIVAMYKRARFDPVLENRLHVYTLIQDRCVPLWRGTRLAGRYDRISAKGGQVFALERIGRGRRRLARYKWTGFGYAVDDVLWVGKGELPKRFARKYPLKGRLP